MEGYLGEQIVDISETPYKGYSQSDWAKLWIKERSQYDGEHHKMQCLDEVLQILCDTPVVVKLARWSNGFEEFRYQLGDSSDEYSEFVATYNRVDGEEWDLGI